MDRRYPILIDIGTQIENSDQPYVFFYDDGAVYRAFTCDEVTVSDRMVKAHVGEKIVAVIPLETPWRMVSRDNLEFVSGSEMEEIELRNVAQKRDLQKRLVKELGLDKPDDVNGENPKTEYDKGYNPKLYT